jgi:hypothetical protein
VNGEQVQITIPATYPNSKEEYFLVGTESDDESIRVACNRCMEYILDHPPSIALTQLMGNLNELLKAVKHNSASEDDHQPEIWTCPQCTLENSASLAVCEACGGSKPTLFCLRFVYRDSAVLPTGSKHTIRSGPSYANEVLTHLAVGDECEATAEVDGWLAVSIEGQTGVRIHGWSLRAVSGTQYLFAESAEEAAARQQAVSTGDIVFEGQQPGEAGDEYMHGFELAAPLKMVNGRAVWQALGHMHLCVFLADNGVWYIGDLAKTPMCAGKAGGWVRSIAAEPDALTPDQVKGGWRATGGQGEAMPNVLVRQWAAPEKAAAAERARRLEEQAKQAAIAAQGSAPDARHISD